MFFLWFLDMVLECEVVIELFMEGEGVVFVDVDVKVDDWEGI